MQKVEERIVRPTVDGLQQEGVDYRGFLFIGLMNVAGEPFVIEYNVRLGDPRNGSHRPAHREATWWSCWRRPPTSL